MRGFVALMAAAACTAASWGQVGRGPEREPGTQDESSMPAHERHLRAHNGDLPAAHDAARFTTNRPNPIELPLPGEEGAFCFVVYGDRTGGPDTGIGVLKDAVRDTNLLEPDLVITVGDMIQGYNESPRWMEQMREFKGVMDELVCPWFPVAGNHDVYWRATGGGEPKPVGEHEGAYESHFGPLWYAFEHKGCMFVALYTDEGNPETGEKAINRPDTQRMSPEQFAWLGSVLEAAKDMEHVFLFVHHPRWLGGNYGDDWAKVHELLVSAGNVSAVFGGHIHRMRYDPRDGIEYVTLATVGGHNSKVVPQAGWLHHFTVVTVRDGRLALSALPVGEVLDVREITGEFADEMATLAGQRVDIEGGLAVGSTGGVRAELGVPVLNTSGRTAEFTIVPESGDSRWVVRPDHVHMPLEPGESVTVMFDVERGEGEADAAFRPLTFAIDAEVLMPGHRYAIPTIEAEPAVSFDPSVVPAASGDRVLSLDGSGYAEVPTSLASVADGPLTVEAWMRAEEFGTRTGLVSKAESSEFGLFVSDGRPSFSVHVGGAYAEAEATGAALRPGEWHHVAGVFDGAEVRVYADGVLLASAPASGERAVNELPMLIGADVTARGSATSRFRGAIDGVRLSTAARYTGASFTPERTLASDAQTAALYDMDRAIGPWLIGSDPSGSTARLRESASLVGAEP